MNALSLIFFVLLTTLRVLKWLILAYVILSWIPIRVWRVREFLSIVLGPLFTFVRKYSPRIGMMDLSAIFVWILIDLTELVVRLIAQSVLGQLIK